MSIKTDLKIAEYFERRAKLERSDAHERARLLAVAKEYRSEAKVERKRQAGEKADPRLRSGVPDVPLWARHRAGARSLRM